MVVGQAITRELAVRPAGSAHARTRGTAPTPPRPTGETIVWGTPRRVRPVAQSALVSNNWIALALIA